ncbi:50S ribosomal protein L11 methyltransferase [Pararhizobium haloflavum]|uniref:50S ribosomal protein L11 methyltransferase n=1 Tax=Pararhizobium haloflavum TaxID=2037914 RepID=UPI000C191D29|nr:50S ribosomal protein L11 methyltransferase [Pararhizobium haloflavum]
MATQQTRLFITGTERACARVLELLGDVFEDDGLALATMEIDEKADRWEASVYTDNDAVDAVRARMEEALAAEFGTLTIDIEELPDIDWVSKSLEGLKPVRAGRFLVHGSHDRDKVRANDLAIEIDAGQAFGTGHHGTTAGCLEMLEWVMRRRRPARVLDLGTGSGVLAIAAAKLAPARVLATDIDPVAIAVARTNVASNGFPGRIKLAVAAGFHSDTFAANGPFDLIVANILARPLMAMAPDIARHRRAGGGVILSGILAEQRWKVLSAFNAAGLHHRRTLWRNGWVTLCLG